jgi:tRNA 2-thiouridine synthesizing protein E
MSYEVNGETIEADGHGYLVDLEQWTPDVAVEIAKTEEIELGERHMQMVELLRDEYINNRGNQPNERKLLKAMGELWGEKIKAKDLYVLFPKGPAKQAGKIAGLPETKRKGGY